MNQEVVSLGELVSLAKQELSRNSVSSAEKLLEQAVLLHPQEPEVFFCLGHAYTKKGKFKKAILAFQKTLTLDPNHTEAAIALSSLFNDVGKYREGASVFLRTKQRLETTVPGHDPRIDQNLGLRHAELARLYVRFERFAEAAHEFHKAVALDPAHPGFPVELAKCLFRLGDFESTLKVLREALQRNPQNNEARIQLGVVLHKQQKLDEAQREWLQALSFDPESNLAKMYLSMLSSPNLRS